MSDKTSTLEKKATDTINLVSAASGFSMRQTTIRVDYKTADEIGISFEFMPGTRPTDNGALVGLWQDQDQIPWEDEPLFTQATANQQKGSFAFKGLDLADNSYVVGLFTGPQKPSSQKNRNVVSQAWIPGAADPSTYASDSLSLVFVGPSSLAVQFNCLAGFRAGSDGAWMGLWQGEAASYHSAPKYATRITQESNFGTASFNDIVIGIGLTYTVGFFPSGWDDDAAKRDQKVLACSLTFTQGKTK